VCPRGTYGDKGKAAWLRAAPTALLFEQRGAALALRISAFSRLNLLKKSVLLSETD
jgi:hypothetical protein